jgi:non-heme chloroperoxidase
MPYVKVNDIELYYEDEGTGPSLLFVHGWGTSSWVWNGQLADFVADHRVVTVDWRGCGRSARPSTGNDISTNVDDLAAVIDTLGLGTPVVVGSSIGAVYATELALRHPAKISRIISVDGPGYWPSAGMLDKVSAVRRNLVSDRAGTLAAWLPNWFAPGTLPELVDWTLGQLLDSSVFIEELFTECTTYDPRPRLPDLETPITYVHGGLDAEIPLEVLQTCATLTGAPVVVIEGAGHLPYLEKPVEFNAVLREAIRV